MLDSLDSSKSSLERLTNSVDSLLIHKDFHRLVSATERLMKEQKQLDPVPRVNSCPRGFCCYAKLDSSYQVSKIAEIF